MSSAFYYSSINVWVQITIVCLSSIETDNPLLAFHCVSQGLKVGSSRIIIFASDFIKDLAKRTRCFSPPDSLEPNVPTFALKLFSKEVILS